MRTHPSTVCDKTFSMKCNLSYNAFEDTYLVETIPMQPEWHYFLRIVLYTTWGYTLVINPIKAANVTKLSSMIQILKYIWEFTLGRDHFNVSSVYSHTFKNTILKPIWWVTQERNHNNAVSVVRLYQIE